MSHALMTTYARLPIAFSKGEGAYLSDTDGKRYLDALSGIAVCGLGHAHPAVAAAIADQAHTLMHTSNLYEIPLQEKLGEALCALSGMDNVFFANSGAEANEAAIKLARLYGNNKGFDVPKIIVMEGSFHGRTLATLSATGNKKVKKGFKPLVEGFITVPYNDIAAVNAVLDAQQDIAAILLEPIQGEGGINTPDDHYLHELRQLCDQHDCLLMLDEIQSGMARSGQWFAFQHTPIKPDVMTLAKGLGNGFPIGACLAKGKAAELFAPGNHGSTFGGNPLGASAALAVIDVIEKDNLCDNAENMGNYMLNTFKEQLAGIEQVVDIRGKGLLIGIELDKPCGDLVQAAMDAGLIINVTAERTIRLLPPLIIHKEQADKIIEIVCSLIKSR